ncbi:hypothetical protein ACWGI9_43775 [Streptomyces sp. NPDC054833]
MQPVTPGSAQAARLILAGHYELHERLGRVESCPRLRHPDQRSA